MADKSQASTTSETEISVDMNAADDAKAVTRRSADIAKGVRETADVDPPSRTKAEKELFKRMGRLERNLEKQFDQRMANAQAEWQRERSDLKAQLDRVSVERGGDDAADAAHDAAIGALKDQLAAACEKGDSQAQADITLKISKLDSQFWAKKAAAAGVATREVETTAQAEQRRPAGKPPENKGPTVAGARFIRVNEDWWEDPDFEVERAAANTIFLRLVNQEGFEAKDDETYKEVAKQLKAKFPKLKVHARGPGDDDDDSDDDEATRDDSRQVRRQAAAARIDDRGTAGNQNRGTRRTLTKEDIQTMKSCRLDPDNDKDVVQFLREAVALESAQ